jgi:hypothetical protein
MNEKYLNYNIIPIGDHCAISMILKELGLRRKSYPFDWIMHTEGIHNTNIIQNVEVIDLLKIKTIENIFKLFIDNAFDNENKTNSKNICFPHDTEKVCEIFTKYERRFTPFYISNADLTTQKNNKSVKSIVGISPTMVLLFHLLCFYLKM